MGDLSDHFNSSEFVDPETGEVHMDVRLIYALEALRAVVERPIRIISGYRSSSHNIEVGGVSHSQHLLGRAADIQIYDLNWLQMFLAAEQITAFRNGGIGVYPEQHFIHVDVRETRARWSRVAGVYREITAALAV